MQRASASRHRELAQALDGIGNAVGFATIPRLVELNRYEGHRPGAEGDLLQVGELDDDGVTIDDRGVIGDPDDVKLLAEQGDVVADMLVQRARDILADQRGLGFVRLGKAAL